MPVLSPPLTPNSSSHSLSVYNSSNKATSSTLHNSELEESNENVTKEKMANMKLIMKTFFTGAIREKAQGNTNRYNELIEILSKDPNSPDSPSTLTLYIWLLILTQSVSSLDKTCDGLVEAALNIDWSFRNQQFVDTYIDFLKHLVSAHAFYIVPVLNSIVQNFNYRMEIPPFSRTTRTGSYNRYHIALQCVLELIPTGTNSLFVSIVRHLPHKRCNTAEQAAYIKNILYVSEYVPALRRQIIGLVIDRATQIDSHIQIELDETEHDIEFEVYHIDYDDNYNSDESDDGSDEETYISDLSDDESVGSFHEDKHLKNDSIKKIKYMVRKLDTIMSLIFDYFSRCALSAPSDVQNELFHALVDVFDRSILKTLKSRYTQFLLFYFCSINVTIYSDFYLEHLVQHAVDPLKPTVTRVASASYISSYVARAKFIEDTTIQNVILTLTNWCNAYIEYHDPNFHGLESSKHEVFYAVVQAILYIFCFRWRELVLEIDELVFEEEQDDNYMCEYQDIAPQSGDGSRNWCTGMRNLSHIIMSRFNPLKMCSPAVVNQFAKIARNTHFMYVYPLLEKNRDIFVMGLGESGLMKTIQTFFPFDPYKLEASKVYIDNIYFEWIADDDDDDDDESEEDSDDEEDDMTTGMMAMSISPSPAHYLN